MTTITTRGKSKLSKLETKNYQRKRALSLATQLETSTDTLFSMHEKARNLNLPFQLAKPNFLACADMKRKTKKQRAWLPKQEGRRGQATLVLIAHTLSSGEGLEGRQRWRNANEDENWRKTSRGRKLTAPLRPPYFFSARERSQGQGDKMAPEIRDFKSRGLKAVKPKACFAAQILDLPDSCYEKVEVRKT